MTEDPLAADDGDDEKGETEEEEEVGEGEIEDVGVGDGTHLGKAQDNRHYEAIAEDSDAADEAIKDKDEGHEGQPDGRISPAAAANSVERQSFFHGR